MSAVDHFEEQIAVFESAGNTVIGRPARILGACSIPEFKTGSVIEFGENVTLRNTSFNFPLGGGKVKVGKGSVYAAWTHVSPKSVITVGERTAFIRDCEVHAWESASIDIGNDCLLSNIKIRTSDMHSIFALGTNERVNSARSVVIGDRVWVAEFAVVGKGSRIDNGSVIGSYAFVTGYIPPNSIAAGQPARVLKRGIYWTNELDVTDPVALPATSAVFQQEERRRGLRHLLARWLTR